MTTQEIASTIYIKLLDCIDRTKAGDWEDVVSQCEEIAQLASHAKDQKKAWEHLKPYGYAPGDYSGKCIACGKEWQDQDKRAWTCRECAEKIRAESLAAEEAYSKPPCQECGAMTQEDAPWPDLPDEPPSGLLMSMAIRFDHGLGLPGYYDAAPFRSPGQPSHAQRLDATLRTMRQLYEEVSGYGFYSNNLEKKMATKMVLGITKTKE